MSGRILVVGATGYTGGLVVDSLIGRGVRPTLVGRSESSLRALAESKGDLPFVVQNLSDHEGLQGFLGAGDVVVTTVGPFARLGWVVAKAAAKAGAHYVDTTGEVEFVRELRRRFDDIARSSGSSMLPAFGYDYVPGVLAGALAAERAPELSTLKVGYFATGSLRNGLSKGTRATMADGLTLPSLTWRNKSLQDAPTAGSLHRFTVRGNKKTAVLLSGTEVLDLPASYPQIETLEVFNGWFPRAGRAIKMASRAAKALSRSSMGRKAIGQLGSLLARGPVGPGPQERGSTRTHVVAEAFDVGGGKLTEVHLEGPSIYSLTAELVTRAALDLSPGSDHRRGVVGPLDIYTLSELTERAADVGLVEVAG